MGDNLLHSISEVLDVPFESELIEAWKQAYLQLADILIGVEKQKYSNLAEHQGGWAGWRSFKITQVEDVEGGKRFTIEAADGQPISPADAGAFISVRVHVLVRNCYNHSSSVFRKLKKIVIHLWSSLSQPRRNTL